MSINSFFSRPGFLSEPPYKGRRMGICILITLLLFFISSAVISVVTTPIETAWFLENFDFQSLAQQLNGSWGSVEEYFSGLAGVFKEITDMMTNLPPWISLVSLFSFAVIIITVFVCRKKIEKGTFLSMGFTREGVFANYAKGLLVGFVIFSAAVGLGWLTGGLEFGGFSVSDTADAVYVVLFFLGYVVQGMAEEVLCRGYLMTSLTRRYSIATAVLVNSAFFALLHMFNNGVSLLAFVNLTLYGIFASMLMLKTGNIWIVGAVHTVWNFVQGNLYGISVSGMGKNPSVLSMTSTGRTWLNGGKFGMEGGICVSAVLIAGIAVLAILAKRENEKRTTEPQQETGGNVQ